MDLDQRAPIGEVCSESTLLEGHLKHFSRQQMLTNIVVIGA